MNRKIAKTLSILLALTALAVTQVPVSDAEASAVASDFEMEGNKLLKYTGTAEVVSIPDSIKVIGEEAFAGNEDLIKVTVAGDVEEIGYRAFAGCDNLRTIELGDGVKTLDTAAFANDGELVNVTLGAGVKDLGTGVFAGCGQLKELQVSEDNPYLHYSNGVLYDDEETILYAVMPGAMKGAYTLPSTVKEIKGYAFWGNPYLEELTLGSGLLEVPAYAFSNCSNLKNVYIPLPVRGIGAKAFEDCVNLEKVTLPDSMANISDSAFDGCPNVSFDATLGTYSGDFAAAFQKSDVEEVEYEEVQDSQVIDPAQITNDTSDQAPANDQTTSQEENTPQTGNPSPSPTIGVETTTVNNLTILGQSSIVSGRAVIFIDNRQASVMSGGQTANGTASQSGKIDLSGEEQPIAAQEGNEARDLLVDNAQKGKDFPKYTVAGDKIASQAFYQQADMTDYEIPEGITEIGEFAFARSGLKKVIIPEGVTTIDYGAFYHCDQLTEVQIPSSVSKIDAHAFDNTPWLSKQLAGSSYVIVGDGILLAYGGTDSVVNIPSGVKQIGPQVFKDHMGITAVNIPDTVEVIGEEAFMGCRNLKTVNGGKNLTAIEDRAFKNCPLSSVTIPASVKSVGLEAYEIPGGTDTVVFEGTELPVLTMGNSAKRLANKQERGYAFSPIKNAVVPEGVTDLTGTVLESGKYGFAGTVVTPSGTVVADNTAGVQTVQDAGVSVVIDSASLTKDENTQAQLAGESGSFVLKIKDSEDAAAQIAEAYGELYGGKEPDHLLAYDISLYDNSQTIPITKLGKQTATIQLSIPDGISPEKMHVVTLDQDGQLEAVQFRLLELSGKPCVQFTTNHFSPYGVYTYSDLNGQAVVTNGKAVITDLSGNKDDTPDTGDPIHPKWFLAIGLLAGAVALFFYKGKRKGIS